MVYTYTTFSQRKNMPITELQQEINFQGAGVFS